MAHVVNKFNEAEFNRIIRSPRGPLAKNMLKRGKRVESLAKKNLGGGTGSGPRRVNTGRLRRSIQTTLQVRPEGIFVKVGTNLYYARWVHDGTGIYGPKHKPITPKNGRFLAWKAKKTGLFKKFKKSRWIFARSVKGMRPNHFLRDALKAFRL